MLFWVWSRRSVACSTIYGSFGAKHAAAAIQASHALQLVVVIGEKLSQGLGYTCCCSFSDSSVRWSKLQQQQGDHSGTACCSLNIKCRLLGGKSVRSKSITIMSDNESPGANPRGEAVQPTDSIINHIKLETRERESWTCFIAFFYI